jgi:hypothetical protein
LSDRATIVRAARELATLEADPEGDAHEHEMVERVREVGQHLTAVVEATSATLVPEGHYASLWVTLGGPVLTPVQAYTADHDPAHLDSALAQIPNYLAQLNTFGVLTRQPPPSEAAEEVTRLRRSVGQHLRVIDDEAEDVKLALKGVQASVEAVKAEDLADLVAAIAAAKTATEDELAALEGQIARR